MANYTGSCHCGKIAYRVEGEIDQALDCNCSLCRRRGGLLWFVPRTAFTLTSDPAALGTYTFNKHAIAHHFCADCGIAPFSEGAMPDGTPMTAINLRCLDEMDLSTVAVIPFNGRDV